MKQYLIQLAELADKLDEQGLNTEAEKIDTFIKEAMRAEVESGMDMLLYKMLSEYSAEQILNKVKEKIEKIKTRKREQGIPEASMITQAK